MTCQRSGLIKTDAREGVKASGREDLQGGDTAEIQPVITVRSPREARVIVPEVLPAEKPRSVGKHDVVLGKALIGGGRR